VEIPGETPDAEPDICSDDAHVCPWYNLPLSNTLYGTSWRAAGRSGMKGPDANLQEIHCNRGTDAQFRCCRAYAEQRPIKMKVSGTLATSAISLAPDTNTDEQNLAGNGPLGAFTFRELHADPVTPQTPALAPAPITSIFPTWPEGAYFALRTEVF
jgi:hypothetical protein